MAVCNGVNLCLCCVLFWFCFEPSQTILYIKTNLENVRKLVCWFFEAHLSSGRAPGRCLWRWKEEKAVMTDNSLLRVIQRKRKGLYLPSKKWTQSKGKLKTASDIQNYPHSKERATGPLLPCPASSDQPAAIRHALGWPGAVIRHKGS